MSGLQLVTVPKWGLSMEEGQVVAWHKQVGDQVVIGDELVDIETTKITNSVEAPSAGILRRILAEPGAVLPCGAVLGVIGSEADTVEEIDALIAEQAVQAAEAAAEGGMAAPVPEIREVLREGETRRLRYLDVGASDAAVVLIHGFGGDLENWMFNQSALASAHRVIAIDLPGHGGSDKRVGDGSAAALARDVAALLDEIAPGKLHFVAHSFGAVVVRELLALLPDRALSVTAIAPADLAPVNRAYIDGFLNARRRSDMTAAVSLLFSDPQLATRDMSENLLRFKRLDGVDVALRAIDSANFTAPAPDPAAVGMWRELGSRGFVIWGDADAVVPHSGINAVDAGVRRLVIANSGHMPHLEKADQINAAIEEHLSAQVES